MTPGKLIVFEGPDSVGKTSLALKLFKFLKSRNVDSTIMSSPGKTPGSLGEFVYKVHHNRKEHFNEDISETSLQILHIAAHNNEIENRIRPLLKSGKVVILDRFWWSLYVYSEAAKIKEGVLSQIIKLDIEIWKDLQPTMIFYIDRKEPFDQVLGNNSWKDIRRIYRKLAKAEHKNNNVMTIKNNGSFQNSCNEVCENVLNSLNSSRDNANNTDLSESNETTNVNHFARLSPIEPTEVYDTYWRFAAERQCIFYRRLSNSSPPWTEDPIFSKYKFTNAYRASDRVSQYLIKNVIYRGDQSEQELFFRILLFKTFNRIETWESFLRIIEEVSFKDYSFEKYNTVLSNMFNRGERIYSGAYIMASAGKTYGFQRKHSNHLKLIEQMIEERVPEKVTEARSMKQVFELLRTYPTIGDFLAYQYVIDLNYSCLTNFEERDFVVAGPGAKDGIKKCFRNTGGLSEIDLIMMMYDRQEEDFARLNIEFKSLWGRKLQPIDCQNLFCEVDKYSRVAHPNINGISGRKKIKQYFRPKENTIKLMYPPKWGINDKVKQSLEERSLV